MSSSCYSRASAAGTGGPRLASPTDSVTGTVSNTEDAVDTNATAAALATAVPTARVLVAADDVVIDRQQAFHHLNF